MKSLLAVVLLVALGGCVVAPPGPAYYGSRWAEPFDPYQWHTVSAVPVYAPQRSYGNAPVYVQQTVYLPQPLYAPQPYFYTPPVSIGLDFMFGWSGGRHGGRHHGWGGRGHGHR
ncbi:MULTISPECIES: hypothetical protein [unclassified Janthinobacterium]|uniref:hypothetical protein n=1 Tax=unclassified Janthinobacterium TaxID=2610881 RepID=UPI0009DADE6F|nr:MULTISPECIES: hypothetical protein [unclassified Janthinobacterium]MEC5163147.1 hypothetical protein [Janthinobacterium sp. CG_S6]